MQGDEEQTLENTPQLDRFLAGAERRAFQMARLATGSREDALDIVQDAMFKLVEKYAGRPAGEWGPLFQKILQSRILDWYRHDRIRNRVLVWFGRSRAEEEETEPEPAFVDAGAALPEDQLASERRLAQLETALERLSLRQRQAFLLRCWEGLDVRDTARAMSCSEGSVKTHFSRAVHLLRELLEDYW